jgi:thymidylate kinase
MEAMSYSGAARQNSGDDLETSGAPEDSVLQRLARNLAHAQIRYCVLHGWTRLPEWRDGDIDVAIAPEQLELLDSALEDAGDCRIVQLLQHETTGFFFVAWSRTERRFLLFDAATDYRRDGRIFFTADQMLDDAREWNGFKVSAPAVEFGYLLVKKISKLSLAVHQRARLLALRAALGPQAVGIAATLLGDARGTKLDEWLVPENQTDTGLGTLRGELRREVLRRDSTNALRYWLPELTRRWRRWRNPSGLLVAIMGPDGAGKSTLINGLDRTLQGAFRHTSSFHLRPAVLRRRSEGPPVTDPHAEPLRSPAASIAKLAFYWTEYLLGYALRLRPALSRSTLIFADRYFDDLLVDARRYRYGGPAWLPRLMRNFVPQPDLWLFVEVPETQLLQRKQEVSLEESRRQRTEYRELAGELRNAVVLDGSAEPAGVVAQASEVCLDFLSSRYKSRRSSWFTGARNEDLGWLSGVLLDPDRSRFEIRANKTASGWRDSGDNFQWLRLGDGRGFLFPRERALIASAGDLYNAHKLKGRLGKFLIRSPLLHEPAARFLTRSVTIQHRDGGATEASDRSRSVFDLIRIALKRADLRFAVSLGTPGPQRKPVIQVMTPEGATLAYAKVGANSLSNKLVENEADTLSRMSKYHLRSFERPRLLLSTHWNSHSVNLQSAPQTGTQSVPNSFSRDYAAVIAETSKINLAYEPLGESTFWRRLERKADAIRHPYFRALLDQAMAQLRADSGAERFAFHFSHGDFAPWNIRMLDGRTYVFDWEFASDHNPAGWDIFHFFTQTCSLLRHYSPARIWREFSIDGQAAPWLNSHFNQIEVSPQLIKPTFMLYLADHLANQTDRRDADADQLRRLATLLSLGLGELREAR